jgi:uncharacterized membrane protein YqjE
MDQIGDAKLQAVAGLSLMTTPVWVIWLQYIDFAFSAVAAICGAIIGIHAVWRLYRRRT